MKRSWIPALCLCLALFTGCDAGTDSSMGSADVSSSDSISSDASGSGASSTADSTGNSDGSSTGSSADSSGNGTNSSSADGSDAPPVAATQADPANSEKLLHITVEDVKISRSELAASDYTVPVLITLDKNPGITYSEWGLYVDGKCTFTANKDTTVFHPEFYINDEKHFIWTAWMSSSIDTNTGSMLELQVKLPMDAAPGSHYPITYADTSQADKPHLWQGDSDWASLGNVDWTDGGITVTD